MTNRLVLLLGEFETSDSALGAILHEWSDAGLLSTVGWCSIDSHTSDNPNVKVSDNGILSDSNLFTLLTSRIWSQVSVVAVRQEKLKLLSKDRFDNEEVVLQLVRQAFAAHRQLEFNCYTVSIGEEEGLVYRAFAPNWKMHILHEPVVRIDEAVASQPMAGTHRPLLVGLLSLVTSGGFVWQTSALVSGITDHVNTEFRPIRIGRVYLRVVNAGRLTDEVLSGAFPASGPWSIPSDVPNVLAVPPGSTIPEKTVVALCHVGKFEFLDWKSPEKERPIRIGIWESVKLFFEEFVNALESIPKAFVEKVKREIEEFVQKTTFGANSQILVRFDPSSDYFDNEEILIAIRGLHLGTEIDPIGDADAWEALQRVSMSSVDGGRFPSEVPAPVRGSSRLVYTNPLTIGPSPADESFEVSDFERSVLNLDDSFKGVGPMDLEKAAAMQFRLEKMRGELPVSADGDLVSGNSLSSITQRSNLSQQPNKKVRWGRRRKQRKALEVAARVESARKRAEEIVKFAQERAVGPASSEIPPNETPQIVVGETGASAADSASEIGTPEPTVTRPEIQSTEPEQHRHKPTHPKFDPTEYTPITSYYQGERPELLSEFAGANKIYDGAINTYPITNGYWRINQSCDHCGTTFDHGFAYLHTPSNEIVHVGRICARKALALPADSDLYATKVQETEKRFLEWKALRSGSLLWRVGESIVGGIVSARSLLSQCLEYLESAPEIDEEAAKARKKFRTWTRRGLLVGVLVLIAAFVSIFLSLLPLILLTIVITSYFSAFIVRMIFMAREIVRLKYAMKLAMFEYERHYEQAKHAIFEIVRLSSVRDQFEDWQTIVREIVHVPFGKEIGFPTLKLGVEDVTRPPAMILGKSRPDDKQRMQLFLNARRQTIHGGWLMEILDVLKDEWKTDYETARLTTTGDNILPEADNSSAQSVVGKRPLSDDDVYYPRADLRRRIVAGDLQRKLVARKAEQVAEDLRLTALDQLLAKVEVTGLGSALNGQMVSSFLEGLSAQSSSRVPFPADLVSDKYPSHRLLEPELILPQPGTHNTETGQIQVKPGIELTAAAWRVELSGPIVPLEILRGFEGDSDEIVIPSAPKVRPTEDRLV